MSKEVATIWLTNYCNMDCTYCYENKKKHEKMSGYKAREVIKFIKKRIEVNRLSEYIIRFHGGEPLLNAEAIQIFLRELKSVKKCKIRYYITTNGTLYNEKIEKILVHMDEISISIDGNKKIHDQQRIDKNGNGTFDLVIKNYEKIKQVNQNTSIRMTITPNNIDFLFESIKELEFHYRIKRFIPQIDFTAKWNEEHYDSLILQFTRIKKYGVFLSFDNGYVGLLHISEISTNFVNNINSYFSLGDKIKVLIKKIDQGNKFLFVSIKDLPDELNPYKEILPSKKIVSYLKDINFSKLEKALPKMIEEELEREDKND